MRTFGHFVDFYDSERRFVASAATFLHEAFVSGGSCIAVLTTEHRNKVECHLRAYGLEPAALIDAYRYVPLDAKETLSGVWRDEQLDATALYREFDDLIRLVGSADREVWIIGEMVALLARDGHVDAALQIEELCNALSREHAFRMYCLYPQAIFGSPTDDPRRQAICAVHSGALHAMW